jgi:hypothetical protein
MLAGQVYGMPGKFSEDGKILEFEMIQPARDLTPVTLPLAFSGIGIYDYQPLLIFPHPSKINASNILKNPLLPTKNDFRQAFTGRSRKYRWLINSLIQAANPPLLISCLKLQMKCLNKILEKKCVWYIS